jgi:hypothetical protein
MVHEWRLTNPTRRSRDQAGAHQWGFDLPQFATLAVALVLLAFGSEGAIAQQGQAEHAEPEGPNALTTLLPHQKGRALCYVSSNAPVTFPLEDIPPRKKPRRLTVRRFLFELSSEKFDDDDTTTPPTPGKPYYAYRLLAEVKGRKRRLVAVGECGSRDLTGFGCGVECDGGTMHFEPLKGSESLQMRVSDQVNRFRMTWGCGEGEDGSYEVLTYDPATPAVRMEKADPKACAAMDRQFEKRK